MSHPQDTPLVSTYSTAKNSRHKNGDLDLADIVGGIRSGKWADQTAAVRNAKDDAGRRALKASSLLGFTPTGTQPTEAKHSGRCKPVAQSVQCDNGSLSRNTLAPFDSRTGLVAVDLDFYKGTTHNAAEARDTLAKSEHCAVAFVSVSGLGVKALVRVQPVPRSQAEHKRAWEAVCSWVSKELGLQPNTKEKDPPGNNIAHLQFVSHDPDAHIDLDVAPLEWEKQSQTSQSSERTAEAGWSRDDVEKMLRYCDVDGSWPDYRFKIARAIRDWDDGGSRGKAVWLAWVGQGTRSPHTEDI